MPGIYFGSMGDGKSTARGQARSSLRMAIWFPIDNSVENESFTLNEQFIIEVRCMQSLYAFDSAKRAILAPPSKSPPFFRLQAFRSIDRAGSS
jgi:hypothetical protein